MKLVILIVALFGAVSGDVSEIINSSRQYLPPSREYLPPLLAEYMQSPPQASEYVQDPPIFTNIVEILSTVGPDNAASLTEEQVFIPVQVVVDTNVDSAASLRQYLPPLTVSTTVLPQLSEETVENETTPKTVLVEDDREVLTANPIEAKELIDSTTPDVINEVDNETTATTEDATLREANKEEDTEDIVIVELKDTVVITTAVPDTVAPVTTESLEIVTVGDSEAGASTTVSTHSTSESVTDANQDVATTENVPELEADTDSKEGDIEDVQTISTTEGVEITTVDSAPAVELRTESATEAIQEIATETIQEIATEAIKEIVTESIQEITTETVQTVSTTDTIEVTTSNSASVNAVTDVIQENSVSEDTPVVSTVAPADAVTTESEPVSIQVLSTTVPEYIQNAQKQVTTDEPVSESDDSVRSNNLEATEVTSEDAVAETKVSTPETVLLEDGYHYSIPSILFG